MIIDDNTKKRFWNKVIKVDDNECWSWDAYKLKDGYGRFRLDHRMMLAHRMSWIIEHGKNIPDGLQVCHACDNPSCVNPTHLFLGTQSENMNDCVDKGRLGERKGECNRNSRLTKENVVDIRKEYKKIIPGGLRADNFIMENAKRYGVTFRTVQSVVYRQSWKHID